MSEATKKRRPSGHGDSAPVLTVVCPAGDSTASGLGKKSVAALGKTLRKAAKAADEAGLAVTLDLGALSTRKSAAKKSGAGHEAGTAEGPPNGADPAAPQRAAGEGAIRPEPVKRAAAAQLPEGRRTTRTTATGKAAVPKATSSKTANPKTTSSKATNPKTTTSKTASTPATSNAAPAPDPAGSSAADTPPPPRGARRPRPTPRRTPARPPVSG